MTMKFKKKTLIWKQANWYDNHLGCCIAKSLVDTGEVFLFLQLILLMTNQIAAIKMATNAAPPMLHPMMIPKGRLFANNASMILIHSDKNNLRFSVVSFDVVLDVVIDV